MKSILPVVSVRIFQESFLFAGASNAMTSGDKAKKSYNIYRGTWKYINISNFHLLLLPFTLLKKVGFWEDVNVANCLYQYGVTAFDTRDPLGKHLWFYIHCL